ncbi:MAG: hypothetical protein AAF826_11200 [Pseudomonadota bacterium]
MKERPVVIKAALLGAGILAGFSAWHFSQTADQPYRGQETRDIAALSTQDVDDLLAGRGWGLALPAELNGFPDPAHVLELADAMELTATQRAEVERIRAEMKREAVALGESYVALEASLDEAFESGAIDADRLAQLTQEASTFLAQLRFAHLDAHLKVTPLLSAEQIAIYNDKRGYSAGAHAHSGHH